MFKRALFISGGIIFFLAQLLSAGTIYKTGFESENELFGNFKKGSILNQNNWVAADGKISKETVHQGSQALTPGPGDGKYGKWATRRLDPKEQKKIWVDYYVYPANSRKVDTYNAFLWLKGTNPKSGAQSIISVY